MKTTSTSVNTLFAFGYGAVMGLGIGSVFWFAMMGGVWFLSGLIQYSGFVR